LSIRRLSVLCAPTVLCAAFSPVAAAEPFMLEARGSKTGLGEVRAIGGFRPERDPTLDAANGVFGRPTKVVRTSDASCRVLYGAIGLRFAFVNLGGGGPCDPEITKSQMARAFDPRWHTGRGLFVGDSLRSLRRLYPRATRHGRSWWLVKGMKILGVADNPYPVLRATVKDGRVRSFALSIGAAGE
jgi:hypothetical protein